MQPGNHQQMVQTRLAKVLDGVRIDGRAIAQQCRFKHCSIPALKRPRGIQVINAFEKTRSYSLEVNVN